uniref:Uncharacterized protein n=1 Tax=Panstrongylus lignarius TaxID=156445 RepID=A0A224XN90_9HEMI
MTFLIFFIFLSLFFCLCIISVSIRKRFSRFDYWHCFNNFYIYLRCLCIGRIIFVDVISFINFQRQTIDCGCHLRKCRNSIHISAFIFWWGSIGFFMSILGSFLQLNSTILNFFFIRCFSFYSNYIIHKLLFINFNFLLFRTFMGLL